MRTYRMNIGGEPFEARILEYSETKVVVSLNGDTYDVEIEPDTVVPTKRAPKQEQGPTDTIVAVSPARPTPKAGSGTVTAPIPGVVRTLLVKEGDVVTEGQPVLVLEAMKMENEIMARSDGTITAIHVTEGDAVQEDQPLLDIGASA